MKDVSGVNATRIERFDMTGGSEIVHGAVRQSWAGLREEIEAHYAALWQTPELPNMEYRSAALLCDWLESHGFTVERKTCGIETAFVARKGRGRPVVALLAEFDALPGLGNSASGERAPTGQAAGHACGHNHIGPTNTGAAIAAAQVIEQAGLEGEIRLIGCPSEEILWGKVALLKRGAFDDVDAILTSHGDYQTGAISQPCQSVINTEIIFEGAASHGGVAGGHNALVTAGHAVQAIERQLAPLGPETRVQHVFRTSGVMPSITPDEVRVWLTARSGDYEGAAMAYDTAVGICRETALAAGVDICEQFISESRGYLPNDVLARHLLAAMHEVGPPQWSDEALSLMADLSAAGNQGGAVTLDREVALYDDGMDPYGQDDGEASWRVPLGRANWAYPEEIPLHNWAMTAFSGNPASNAGPLMVSEALAIAAVGLLRDPAIIDAAGAELAGRVAGIDLGEPRLGAEETMARAPETFWDATWREPV